MSAERFFDDLARTLAESMPRRRAVRIIGASVAALAIPGVSPRLGRAAVMTDCKITPCLGQAACCPTSEDPTKPYKCCPYPEQQWACGDQTNGYKCRDGCPPVNPVSKKKQTATWSSAKFDGGRPQRYNCCPVPDYVPRDGECLPNCKRQLGPNAIQCGKYCCPPGHRCKGSQCIPCPRGREGCGSTCCKSGQDCTECYEATSDYSTRDAKNGRERCCGPDEFCCRNTCCELAEEHCCGSLCCPNKTTRCAKFKGQDICCPIARRFRTPDKLQICCPRGTVPVGSKGCCPPGDPNCCPPSDNLGGVLNCAGRGQICVSGNCVTP